MYSHLVIFWTDPAQPNAVEQLIAGAERLLQPIPEIVFFHVGRMISSPRPVVDSTYQVGLNVVFATREARADYKQHPLHSEFEATILKPLCQRHVVYDFE